MHIKNIEDIDIKKMYYCKSPNLMKFLTDERKIMYVNKKKNGFKYVWIFLKTDDLDNALTAWSNNKKNGNLFYKK